MVRPTPGVVRCTTTQPTVAAHPLEQSYSAAPRQPPAAQADLIKEPANPEFSSEAPPSYSHACNFPTYSPPANAFPLTDPIADYPPTDSNADCPPTDHSACFPSVDSNGGYSPSCSNTVFNSAGNTDFGC